MEEWKFIDGYENLYEVSNLGQVRSIARKGTVGKLLKPFLQRKGYLLVGLMKDGKRICHTVHRLVAIAFIPKTDYRHTQIDHINRVRTDNRAVNLRWTTPQENMFNQSTPKNSTTGHIGVHWDKSKNKYLAHIQIEGKKINGGYFDNLEDAIKRRDELKEQYHFIGVNSK